MKLYHGSNVEVKEPKLNYSNRGRDFGNGFYLTSSLEQAKSWAKHRTRIYNDGIPTISVYELDDKYIDNLMIKKFENTNLEWPDFITTNRTSKDNLESDMILL